MSELKDQNTMQCRAYCGACCIAPSISSPTPKHPQGKAAGEACLHLLADFRCELFGLESRPAVCAGLQPSLEMCGENTPQAMFYLTQLEIATAPQRHCRQ
ncbi:YkgJ family cysteine cluster protein [Deefgea salmonis]|uniref:YkgJ family cysteine cluster protein n=1 Tax=Deefgea salmonis TaxID=2875502 RepID=A0ABS8BIN7_9NEIS|nr:YkgJ family cysteine cluster protein [Deefgea salmonis]MCB5195451.1 YkgJ family cysteine cluster protein [Deefgea salmonis]